MKKPIKRDKKSKDIRSENIEANKHNIDKEVLKRVKEVEA